MDDDDGAAVTTSEKNYAPVAVTPTPPCDVDDVSVIVCAPRRLGHGRCTRTVMWVCGDVDRGPNPAVVVTRCDTDWRRRQARLMWLR